MAKKVKVDPAEIKKLRGRNIKSNEFRDIVDSADRGFGRIFSKIGKYFAEDFWK